MLGLKCLGNRLKSIINILLLILQFITASAYFGMVNSRSRFQEISEGIYPDSDYLMNSLSADLLVSYPAFILIVFIIVASVIKEIKIKSKSKKILVNLVILLTAASIYGLASHQLYSSIGSVS